MRIKIKNIIAHILYYTGIVRLLERILLKNRCVVLVYHRIVDPDKEIAPVQYGMYVTPEVFEKHIKYLNSYFNLISMDELISTIKGKRKCCRSCHITFDDGWIDNYTNAYQLLKKYNISATIFLATDFIGTKKWFWPEKVAFLLMKTKNSEVRKDSDETVEVLRIFHKEKTSYEDRINGAINFLKDKSAETIETVIKALQKITGSDSFPQKRLLLNWNEIKEMGDHGIIYGSHTKTHAIMTNLDNDDEIHAELIESKKCIEAKTGNAVKSFCFPNGNATKKLSRIVEASGYDCAFGGGRGTLIDREYPFNLSRISIHNDVTFNISLFACRILIPFF